MSRAVGVDAVGDIFVQTSLKTAVVSCMRNEGQFLLEWIAYNRAIGFDKIFVVTNDCDDKSDQMLDRLERLGYLVHIRNQLTENDAPQVVGMRLALAHPEMQNIDWLLHIDADEFLNVTTGAGMVADLLSPVGDADAIAILWRAFGHNGIGYWHGGSVLEAFTMSDSHPRKNTVFHKTFFKPSRFGSAIDHMPKEPKADDVILINTAVEKVTNASLYHPSRARFRMDFGKCTWENACINHYAIRSQDVFLMKNDRGDGMNVKRNKYFLHSTFYRRYNRNEIEDHSILRHQDMVNSILTEMLKDVQIRELDAAAKDWFIARRDSILTPEQVLKWSDPV